MLACGVDWSQAETPSFFELMSGKLPLVDLQMTNWKEALIKCLRHVASA